jgi:phosphate-selective porin OprO/OprP
MIRKLAPPLAAVAMLAATSAAAQDGRFAGAPRIGSSESWSIKPRGRVQIDAGNVSGPADIGTVGELRRARLGIEGTMPHAFTYVVEAELSEGRVEFTDATIGWRPADGITITFGQHNSFQSMEELTSSRFSSFIERAAFTDAFNFERRLGLSATVSRGAVTVQTGLFIDNLLDIDEGDGMFSVDGRIVFAPRVGQTQLHFGASAHLRDNGDLLARGAATRYRQRPLIHATDVRFLATPALPVDRETGFGLEAAAIRGAFHAAAEAYWLDADLAGTDRNPDFFGFYAEAGWYLTGETRGYRSTRFDRTRVRRPIEQGGFGAVQLNLRYDHLDLNSGTIVGGIQNGLLTSLIWIPTDHLRFMLNYARLQYRDARIAEAGGNRDYDVNVFGARAQFDF